MNDIYKEFEALRTEIHEWQKMRIYLLVSFMTIYSTAIFYTLANIEDYADNILPFGTIALSIIFGISLLYYYLAIGNIRKGSYIQVFIEEKKDSLFKWESRRSKFIQQQKLNLNNTSGIILFIYTIITIIIIIMKFNLAKLFSLDKIIFAESILFTIITILTFVMLFRLIFDTGNKERDGFIEIWRTIRENEGDFI